MSGHGPGFKANIFGLGLDVQIVQGLALMLGLNGFSHGLNKPMRFSSRVI